MAVVTRMAACVRPLECITEAALGGPQLAGRGHPFSGTFGPAAAAGSAAE